MSHPIFDHNDYSEDSQKASETVNYTNWSPEQIDLAPVNYLLRQASNNSIKQASPHQIYQTMIRAGGILDWLGEQKAKAERYKEECEGAYKNKFAIKSNELGSSVADGKRKARQNEEVAELRNKRSIARAYAELLENKYKSVEKIYYAFKARYERLGQDYNRAKDGEM